MLEVELRPLAGAHRPGFDDLRVRVAFFAGRQVLADQQPVAARELEPDFFLFPIA